MKRELTCIVCPMGCHLTVEHEGDNFKVEGNTCKRGIKYAQEELTNPKRVITTTVKLENSYLNLLPVKTEDSVPKGMIFEIMEELDKITVTAPINVGDVIVENILGTGVNIVSAKAV
jgi:CxxC motif-containing protein